MSVRKSKSIPTAPASESASSSSLPSDTVLKTKRRSVSTPAGENGASPKTVHVEDHGHSDSSSSSPCQLSWWGLGIVFLLVAFFSLVVNLVLEFHADSPSSSPASVDSSSPFNFVHSVARVYSTELQIIALIGIAIAAPLTHWLAGKRKYGTKHRRHSHSSHHSHSHSHAARRHSSGDDEKNSMTSGSADDLSDEGGGVWHFYMPFVGGTQFITLQAFGWAIYSCVLLGAIYIIFIGTSKAATGLFATIGVGGVLSQLLVLISLQFFVAASSTKTYEIAADIAIPAEGEEGEGEEPQPAQEEEEQEEAVGEEKEKLEEKEKEKQKATEEITPKRRKGAEFDEQVRPPLFRATTTPDQARPPILRASSTPRLLTMHSVSDLSAGSRPPLTRGFSTAELRERWCYGVGWVGLFLVASSVSVAMSVESLEISASRQRSLLSLATCAILLAVPITHVLVAKSARNERNRSKGWQKLKSYSYFQPFVGGPKFVTLQAVAWTVWTFAFIGAVIYIGYISQQTDETERIPSHYFTGVGVGGVISQLLVLLSLRYFDSQLSVRMCTIRSFRKYASAVSTQAHMRRMSGEVQVTEMAFEKVHLQAPASIFSLSRAEYRESILHYLQSIWSGEAKDDFQSLVAVTFIATLPISGAFITMAPIVLTYLLHVYCDLALYLAALPSACIVIPYVFTWRGRPHITGSRSWPWMRYHFRFWNLLERYFSGSIIPVGKLSKEAAPYLFCFHPHGIYPLTVFWATRGALWKQSYPDLDVDPCGASVMFHSPVVRDIMMWFGAREVSKQALDHALSRGRSIILIPGGQREMRQSSIEKNKLVLVTRHKGFVRIAMKHGTPIVPILSLGENQLLANIHAPKMQEWTTKIFGFGIPHYPYGRWWSPIPNPHPVTVIVGEPMCVPKKDNPTDDEINTYHEEYLKRLRVLFEENKAKAGFPECELVYSEH